MQRRTMTVKETAAFLGVHTDTVYDLVKENKIPHLRIRSKILFLPEVLEDWIQHQAK
ncbi:helix-turn-helix domain-containing protein [Oceanobacillus halophilus]|uniref:DNA-binding protein n=1 Tax=Oceanobacillus halophilus TaxID=930130 RepID=A0A494ZV71_9BACI|nr:helix-turn-helix domain-containing protein [Oceanobacillus halophilus]RKQ30017.1 DNA-binding protein [Oceanobacillus halophilus]